MEPQQETAIVDPSTPTPGVPTDELSGIKALLHEAWGKFTSRFTDLMKLEVIVWVPFIIGALLIAAFVLPHLQSQYVQSTTAEPAASGKVVLGIAWILMLAGVVLRIVVSAGEIKMLASDASFSVSQAWSHGWKRFFPMIGHGILLFLTFLPILIAFAIPLVGSLFLVLLGGASDVSQTIQLVMFAAGVVCIVLIPVYVFLIVKLGFVMTLVAIGDTTGAFKESWNITKGKFWPVLWRLFVGSVVVGVVSSIITTVLDTLIPGSAEATRSAALTGAGVNLISAIVQFIIMLFAAAYSVSLLRNIQGKTEV
jgi:membrane-anchored glycerophosphoryl diester phosphodiesterase (GDPDase)